MILYLGTSESVFDWNLAGQLNFMRTDEPSMVSLAKAGMSLIHSAVTIARAKRERIEFPPTVIVINPVYFTKSHDMINDGWLSEMVRSPVFLQMNHGNVRAYLTEEVRDVYDQHFALRRILYPATAQEYLGNLIYLSFHQPVIDPAQPAPLSIPVYRFNGSLPNYDKEMNVWAGNAAVDRFSKGRWQVNQAQESVNLKGLASILTVLKKKPAPSALLVLPVNRKFYEYHGLDMDEFDSRYRDIRNALNL